jgi:CHAT domain-containing protein
MADIRAELESRWLMPEPGMNQVRHPLRYEQAQALLNEFGGSMALVEMFVDAEEIIVFTLRAGERQPNRVRLPLSSSKIEGLLKAYYRQIIDYPYNGDVGQSWQDSVRPIITNVMPWLQEATALYLVPHGPLRYLPFHCLEVDGGCLIDRFPIAYAGNLPLLERVASRSQGRERRGSPQALVVGNPTLDLDHAEAEARQVAKRFATEPLIGIRATKVAVRAALAEKDVVHLACHGFHHAFTPLDSGMLLAGRRVLTAEEIIGSGMRADLVVLSACESGLQTDEQGLPIVFLEAGASAVVASLWFVDDAATGKFVLDFYGNLYDSALHRITTTAKALQLAMLKMRMEKPHPYYWAAFELMGACD